MLKNYLLVAFRSLWTNKLHSLINILGLSLGIGVSILISLYVRDEWTFDRFHSRADRIYRVWGKENYGPDQQFFYTTTPFAMGPTLKENFEEIEAQVRINPITTQVKVNEAIFSERVTVAGEHFFDVFDFEPLFGNTKTGLRSQADIVITSRIAEKYFGETSAINKPISIQLGETFENFTVVAVVADVPSNSSINFDILISDLNLPKFVSQRALTSAWFNITPETYLLLRNEANARDLETKFPPLFKTLLGEDYESSHYTAGLQPLTDIHLNTDYPVGIAPVNNPMYSYILAAVACLILIVACINFITLSIGKSIRRYREVGIRKVVGARRNQLIFQFIGEALVVTLISLVVGVGLSFIGLPLFNDLSGKLLNIHFDGFTGILLIGLTSMIGILAGSYPAFALSGIAPVSVFKGIQLSGIGRNRLRSSLVGVQLVLSIFLISTTLLMQDQLSFLQNKDLGFNKEQLVVIPMRIPNVGRLPQRVNAGFEKVKQWKTELAGHPEIQATCGSSHDFGNGAWTNIGYTDDLGTYRNFKINVVDPDYMNTMRMEIMKGRNFSDSIESDARIAIIVNEAFCKEYNWTDPIGKRIPGKKFIDHEVVGVVKDFNYAPLYTKVEPLLLTINPMIPLSGMQDINTDNSPLPKLLVRLKPGNLNESLTLLEGVWKKLNNLEEFAFSFVDQSLARQYESDRNLGKVVSIATLMAVLIGSLGLYGLASLAMQSRTREISIRKVMGASEQSILYLLSKDYVMLILVCLVVSVPFTWYFMQEWLKSFEFRIDINPFVFLLAGGISLSIALITISYQAIKTAWTSPAEVLKCE